MADNLTPEVRSKIMSSIRSKDTKPEMMIRKGLHALGFRFRIHDKKLPGKPDLVFPKYKAVIFIHGCFWHGHENCHIFKMPTSRRDFWEAKISRNQGKDKLDIIKLKEAGWRILTIWECALQGKEKLIYSDLLNIIEKWLFSYAPDSEIKGGDSF